MIYKINVSVVFNYVNPNGIKMTDIHIKGG